MLFAATLHKTVIPGTDFWLQKPTHPEKRYTRSVRQNMLYSSFWTLVIYLILLLPNIHWHMFAYAKSIYIFGVTFTTKQNKNFCSVKLFWCAPRFILVWISVYIAKTKITFEWYCFRFSVTPISVKYYALQITRNNKAPNFRSRTQTRRLWAATLGFVVGAYCASAHMGFFFVLFIQECDVCGTHRRAASRGRHITELPYRTVLFALPYVARCHLVIALEWPNSFYTYSFSF